MSKKTGNVQLAPRLGAVALLGLACLEGGCSDDTDSMQKIDRWLLQDWIAASLSVYDAPPPVVDLPPHLPVWGHRINGMGGLVMKNGFWGDVDAIAGAGTIAKLTSLDTTALRARYAESVTDYEVLDERLRTSSGFTYPLQVIGLTIYHYEHDKWATRIEDPGQTLPLMGRVVLPVGSDPAVPTNPELSALIAELQRFHAAWETH